MNTRIYSVVMTAAALTGCGINPIQAFNHQPTTVIQDERALSRLYGKKLVMDCGHTIINNDGTLTGKFDDIRIAGTWKFEGKLWCRTITDGPERILKNSYDCHALKLSQSRLYGVRNRGFGESYFYRVSGLE